MHILKNVLLFPFRLIWNIIVVVGTISLEVAWVGFIFGSVVGVILVIIIDIRLFLLPLGLFVFITEMWPNE